MGVMDWIFNANAPPGAPDSYAAQQLRQRVALQMLSNRKGFPKTLGEGLTSIGDAIGDRGIMNTLQSQITAQDAARGDAEKSSQANEPRAENTDPNIVPSRRTAAVTPDDSEAEPYSTATAAPPPPPTPMQPATLQSPMVQTAMRSMPQPMTLARGLDPNVEGRAPGSFPGPDVAQRGIEPSMVAQLGAAPTGQSAVGANAAPWLNPMVGSINRMQGLTPPGPSSQGPTNDVQANQLAMLNGQQDRPAPYAPTASLQTGSVSDAPPITGSPRDAITRTLAQRQQPNVFPPPDQPTPINVAALQSPAESATNPPITMRDVVAQSEQPIPVPGARMAQAVSPGSPAPLPNLTPAPVTPIDPSITNMPKPPPLPPAVGLGAQEQYWKNLADKNEGRGGDPATTAFFRNKEKVYSDQRAKEDARNTLQYQSERNLYDQDLLAWKQRNSPKGQAETTEAMSKASAAKDAEVITQRTGLPAEKAIAKFDDMKKGAEKDAYALQQLRLAQEAINSGIVSGIGGEFRVNLERAKAFFGNKPAAELAARSEQFLTAVKSTVGNQLQNIQPGDPRVTNSDINLASGMIGADLSLQRATQDKLIKVQLGDVHKRINQYEELKNNYLGGTKTEKFYDVQFDPIHQNPEIANKWIGPLLAHQNDRAVREEFDARFGPGAADLEIARANRRARR
jgi:hypothetical protein